MKKSVRFIIICLILFTGFNAKVWAQNDKPSNLKVTIYNQNFGLIQKSKSFSLPKGESHIRFNEIPQQLVQGSVLIQSDAEVRDQTFHRITGNLPILLKNYYLHKKINLIGTSGQTIIGTLMRIHGSQAVIKKTDGTYSIISNVFNYQLNVSEFPEDAVFSPYIDCTVYSAKKGMHDFDISYQTNGLNWNAVYSAVINSDYRSMKLNADAFIRNYSGTDYQHAKVKLVAGDININGRIPRPRYEAMGQVAKSANQSISQKPFADYHIYTISKSVNIPQNTFKQLGLFTAKNISIQRTYVYKSHNISVAGHSAQGKVGVKISFINNKSNDLDKPMPAGKVNIYKRDKGQLILIGQEQIGQTPAKAHLSWDVGNAFDLSATETLKKIRHISNRISERTYEITFRNQKNENVTIRVDRNIGSNGEIVDASQKYENVDATTVRFEVPVSSKKENMLRFTVRNSY